MSKGKGSKERIFSSKRFKNKGYILKVKRNENKKYAGCIKFFRVVKGKEKSRVGALTTTPPVVVALWNAPAHVQQTNDVHSQHNKSWCRKGFTP